MVTCCCLFSRLLCQSCSPPCCYKVVLGVLSLLAPSRGLREASLHSLACRHGEQACAEKQEGGVEVASPNPSTSPTPHPGPSGAVPHAVAINLGLGDSASPVLAGRHLCREQSAGHAGHPRCSPCFPPWSSDDTVQA